MSTEQRHVPIQDQLETFTRDDRGNVDGAVEALQDLLAFAETMRLQETYGLSVTFICHKIEWECRDPNDLIKDCRGNTPSAAIFVWLTYAERLGLIKEKS